MIKSIYLLLEYQFALSGSTNFYTGPEAKTLVGVVLTPFLDVRIQNQRENIGEASRSESLISLNPSFAMFVSFVDFSKFSFIVLNFDLSPVL